ncbi:histidine phosphatase family protein [Vibrio splendidus]
MTQTKIFLVRHGQTEWNTQERLQGHRNSPLTALGKAQVEQTKIRLSGWLLSTKITTSDVEYR